MSRTILLADDSVTIQKVIELTFMEEDYDVLAVSDGDEALDKLGDVSPDIVIADVHMPGASGLDVCRRSKELHPEVPVLLLVGTFEPFDESESDSAGADAHLKKPFDSQELLQLVGELMNGGGSAVADDSDLDNLDLAEGAAEASSAETASAAADAAPAESADAGADWGFDAPAAAETASGATAAGAETIKTDLGEAGWGESGQVEVEAPAAIDQQEEPAPVWDAAPEEPAAAPEPVSELVAAEPVVAEEPAASEAAADGTEADEPASDEAASEDDWGFRTAQSVEEGDDEPAIEAPADVAEEPPAAVEPPPEAGESFAASDELDSYGSADVDAAAYGGEAMTDDPAPEPIGVGSVSGLSNEDVDRIARRVTELLGDQVAREVAWEVVPDLAEVVIRERLRELEGQLD